MPPYYLDFFMPQEYVQKFAGTKCSIDVNAPECVKGRKERLSNDLAKFQTVRDSGVIVVALANIETVNNPELLSPCQMYDFYKNIIADNLADSFAVWNLRKINNDYIRVFNAIKSGDKNLVCPNNHTPVLMVIGDKTVDENVLLTFNVSAVDADGNPLTYSVAGLPSGAGFDVASQTFSWTPDNSQSGIYQLTFNVSDGVTIDSEMIRITVNNTPKIRTRISNSFILIGNSTGQFSDAQIKNIAKNYSILNIAKFHAGYDSAQQQEDVRKIKGISPKIKTNVYYSASLVFLLNDADKFKKYYGRERSDFKDEWLLRDDRDNNPLTTGDIIYLGDANTAFADLSNDEYHEWVKGVIGDWKKKAPYDGVFFDNARPLGKYGAIPATSTISGWNINWNKLISPTKVSAYNDGLNALFKDAKPFGDVIYNGIGRRTFMTKYATGNERNTTILDYSDGTVNEGFCLWRADMDGSGGRKDYILWTQEEMIEDINMMIKQSGERRKTILQKVNQIGVALYDQNDQKGDPVVPVMINEEAQVKRYCFGSFLLGHQPGLTFFKHGPDYQERELKSDPAEVSLDFGNPVGKYAMDGVKTSMYKREFEKGIVYVNMSNAAITVIAPYPVVLINGGVDGSSYQQGDSVIIPAKDAWFFRKGGGQPVVSPSAFLKGTIGAWPTSANNAVKNDLMNDEVFGWQVFSASTFKSYCNQYPNECSFSNKRSIILSYAPKADNTEQGLNRKIETLQNNVDSLLANPAYKQKIKGINWDWEYSSNSPISYDLAYSTLKKVYDYAHSKGLIFGLTVQPGDAGLKNAGIDLTKVKDYSDFLMPMEYVQWWVKEGSSCKDTAISESECWAKRKERLNRDLLKFQAVRDSGVKVVVLSTIETTATKPIERLSACRMYDVYKNVIADNLADGFVVWNLKDLSADYIRVFGAIKEGNKNLDCKI